MQADQERFLAAAKIVNQAVVDVALKGAADDVQKAEQTRRQGNSSIARPNPGPRRRTSSATHVRAAVQRPSGITSLGGGQYIDAEAARCSGTPVSDRGHPGGGRARHRLLPQPPASSAEGRPATKASPQSNARFKALESASARADRLVSDLEEIPRRPWLEGAGPRGCCARRGTRRSSGRPPMQFATSVGLTRRPRPRSRPGRRP